MNKTVKVWQFYFDFVEMEKKHGYGKKLDLQYSGMLEMLIEIKSDHLLRY